MEGTILPGKAFDFELQVNPVPGQRSCYSKSALSPGIFPCLQEGIPSRHSKRHYGGI
jgi:hypothetical protein